MRQFAAYAGIFSIGNPTTTVQHVDRQSESICRAAERTNATSASNDRQCTANSPDWSRNRASASTPSRNTSNRDRPDGRLRNATLSCKTVKR